MDALSLLRLQIEWGADEALDPVPLDRLHPVPAAPVAAARLPLAPGPAPTPTPAPARAAGPGPGRVPASGPVAAAREAAAAATDIPSLRAVLAAFDGCGLRDTATNLVFAEGDPASGLVVVGEVPDGEEDRTGHPFAGRPGLLLDRMLDSIGLHRSRLLLTPLIPWRPPGNRPPSELELSICLPFLQRLLVLATAGPPRADGQPAGEAARRHRPARRGRLAAFGRTGPRRGCPRPGDAPSGLPA